MLRVGPQQDVWLAEIITSLYGSIRETIECGWPTRSKDSRSAWTSPDRRWHKSAQFAPTGYRST